MAALEVSTFGNYIKSCNRTLGHRETCDKNYSIKHPGRKYLVFLKTTKTFNKKYENFDMTNYLSFTYFMCDGF